MAKAKKKWYESATLWTNAGALAGLGTAWSNGEMSGQDAAVAGGIALINLVLRLKTEGAIGK